MSPRYAPALALLLAIALVPTVLHSYIGSRAEDGRSATALPLLLSGMMGTPTSRGTTWARTAFAADDCIERRYGPDLTLVVARSYDAKRLYHHPELVAAYGQNFAAADVAPSSQRPGLPVHRLTGPDTIAMYVLLHDEDFIAQPLKWEFSSAFSNLIQPRRPMTLFFVHGRKAASVSGEALLLAAIDNFRAQPGRRSR